ncbi:hypothetical protein ABZ318_30880, partial [Streptomyces sp. NPDC006197]
MLIQRMARVLSILAMVLGVAAALPATADAASAARQPLLTIDKSVASPVPFQQGQTVSFTIAVTNSGDMPVDSSVILGDSPGTGLTVTSMSGTDWNCSGTNCTYFGADPGAGGSYPLVSVTATVASNAPTEVCNTATTTTVGGGSGEASDTVCAPVTQAPPAPAQLSINKTHSGNFTQGGTGTYTLTVSNASGAGTTSGTVTVTDTPPAGVTPDVSSSGGPGWICSQNSGTVTCTRSDPLAPGASYPPITLTVNVTTGAPCTFTNTAGVSGGGSAAASDSDPTTVTGGTCTPAQSPALSVNKSHTGNFTQGGIGTYTIDVSNAANAGPTTGTVTVTDTLPTGVTPTAASGTGWNCSISGQTVTCTRSDALAAGAGYPTINITTNVTTSAPCTFSNTATVSGGGSPSASDNDPTTVTGGT